MARVEVYAWNPRRSRFPAAITRRVALGRRVNNFGDLLGPMIVNALLRREGIDRQRATRTCKLLTVGSVLHCAQDGDVVWGSGVNGKMPEEAHSFTRLDVRAVRGPLTRDFLLDRGVLAPEIFGDPALLIPDLFPEFVTMARSKRTDLTIVPNLHDMPKFEGRGSVLNPRAPVRQCLEQIATSRFVIGSSLHGIIVAEALGIPARLIASGHEHPFKYEDYYRGTGRPEAVAAANVEEALQLGGHEPPSFDATALLNAFPRDLWDPGSV